MKKFLLFAAFCWFSLSGAGVSAAGDAVAGEKLANGTCLACHGEAGNSTIPENPVLAGQVPGYIAAQLAAFKSGERENAVMLGMAASLSEQDMQDLDAYYAAQKPVARGVSEEQQELAMEGGRIYRGGYQPMQIAACMSCHGPAGHGIPPTFPRVSGQHPEYLEQQLLALKKGVRKNDIMNPIAFRLSEEQIKALSLFMAGID